jgi:hypothetical protein
VRSHVFNLIPRLARGARFLLGELINNVRVRIANTCKLLILMLACVNDLATLATELATLQAVDYYDTCLVITWCS